MQAISCSAATFRSAKQSRWSSCRAPKKSRRPRATRFWARTLQGFWVFRFDPAAARPSWLGRRARSDELVDDGVHQRLERGIDDVRRHADCRPALPGLVLALDQHARDRLGTAIEDTHAVIDKLKALDIFL